MPFSRFLPFQTKGKAPHIILESYQQFCKDSSCVINPIAEATFMSEDFVGVVARLSRRVSARQHGRNIFNRYLCAVLAKRDVETFD